MKTLPVADPCELSKNWRIILNNNVYEVEEVNRDEHNVPYSVSMDTGFKTNIGFLMYNTIPLKPVFDRSYLELVGWQPVQLKWKIHPDSISRILAPENAEQLIGYIDTDERGIFPLYRAYVGRYLGTYKFENSGCVSADIDALFGIANWYLEDVGYNLKTGKKRKGPFIRYDGKQKITIDDIGKLLPTTRSTLEILESWAETLEHDPLRSDFRKELDELKKSLDVVNIALTTK